MGSVEAMTKGSDARYLGDTTKLKIAQGVVGAVADKGSVLKFVPYAMHAVRQGSRDLGTSSLQSTHKLLSDGTLSPEVQTPGLLFYASSSEKIHPVGRHSSPETCCSGFTHDRHGEERKRTSSPEKKTAIGK